jgi:hypothetical protein
MTSTAIERHAADNGAGVALFPGSDADEILAVAADVAAKFGDVVRKQRMFKRIGESDHIQIEAWQTIGALTGVVASEGEVEQLPWPELEPVGEAPPVAGREPRNRDSADWHEWKHAERLRAAWELHDGMVRARGLGRAFGFVARFRAIKHGAGVGWGEGRCTRGEASKVHQDDYALASMAQTRAQSRALGAPLKFVVKLAGYETTPAEELDGAAPAPAAAAPPLPWGPVATDEQMSQAANLVRALAAPKDVDGEKFILAMGQHFDGVPAACVTMLRGLQRFITDTPQPAWRRDSEPENAPPPAGQGAYEGVSAADVYPPGRTPGD